MNRTVKDDNGYSKRTFLKTMLAGAAGLFPAAAGDAELSRSMQEPTEASDNGGADYTLRITATPIEIAPKKIISTITYNGQFPGPLLRFKEGQQVTVDVFNDTETPEQLHWHGQLVPVSIDGAAEEGTPVSPRIQMPG